jgi:uncharacterized protein YcbK (DUF882 family)|tara:strand:- start:989 stop:1360 length:372 start_codon:yes stop_codon:yes gene_type:complete
VSYFSEDELRCKCGCGTYRFDEQALARLNDIREEVGFPLPVSSGYRCPKHSIEADKIANGRPPGAHTTGKAVDLAVELDKAHALLKVAFAHNVPRVGVNQRGTLRFIHLDWCDDRPGPTVWSY